MTEPRVFGAPVDVDVEWSEDAPASPLDALRAELAEQVQRSTLVRWWIDPQARPGWWIECDTALRAATMEHIAKAASRGRKDPDPLKASLLVIVESCTAIGKADQTVFGGQATSPFKTGEVAQALAGTPGWDAARAATSEPEWATAVRWILGSIDDDRRIIQLSAAIQEGDDMGRVDEANPTD